MCCVFHIKDSLLNTAARDQVVKIGFNQATLSTVLNYTRNHEMKLFLVPCCIFNALCKRTFNVNKKVIFCFWHKRARVSHARTTRTIENVGIRQVFFSLNLLVILLTREKIYAKNVPTHTTRSFTIWSSKKVINIRVEQ